MYHTVSRIKCEKKGGDLSGKRKKAKMVELELNADELSRRIGMDRATFYRRLSVDGQTFSIKEADAISRELDLTKNEVNEIFFSQFVA